MAETSSWYEETQRHLRNLLSAVAPQLPSVTVGIVGEMIDANECGVALEILSQMLVESGEVVSAGMLSDISSLVERMRMDRVNVDRLRSRAETHP